MTDKDFYTRANRPLRVTEVRIRKLTKGDNFYPPESFLKMNDLEQSDVIWEIKVNLKTGFDRDSIDLMCPSSYKVGHVSV